ncbi:MAG: hypothetical protein AAB652_01830 [Patescibacteria group bacterium]
MKSRRFFHAALFLIFIFVFASAAFFFYQKDNKLPIQSPPQEAHGSAGDLILMWEGDVIPTGWTCISCSATDAFFGVFPRASSSYANASSGTDTVTHTLTFSSADFGGTTQISTDSQVNVASGFHTHTWSSPSIGTGDVRPPFKNLKFIQAATTTLPNGVIGIFNVSNTSSLPTNWSYYSALNGNFLRGAQTTSTGGASTHTHSRGAVTSGSAVGSEGTNTTLTNANIGTTSHTHILISGSLTESSNAPPSIEVVFAQLGTTSTPANGMIALFDNSSLPGGWSIVSTSGSAYAGRLLKGSNAFGTIAGSSSHSHNTSTAITSGLPSATTNVIQDTFDVNAAIGSHTHSATYAISSSAENSFPVYRDVILGQYTNQDPTVSGVLLNSGQDINLTSNATTTVTVSASSSDPDGVEDIRYATSTIYRSAVGATCAASNLNCYQLASSSCAFTDSTSTVRCTASFDDTTQATDASSNFSSENWLATITVTDSAGNIYGSTTVSGVEVNTISSPTPAPTPATIPIGVPASYGGSLSPVSPRPPEISNEIPLPINSTPGSAKILSPTEYRQFEDKIQQFYIKLLEIINTFLSSLLKQIAGG